ncbi:MAG: VOC family protein, partial [Bacteroidota bacterium]
MQQLDHIVYAVPNLEEAINWFEENAGIQPVFGGYHTTQGTKNALLKIGAQCYLELLAVDKENKEIVSPRWMGIDLIN